MAIKLKNVDEFREMLSEKGLTQTNLAQLINVSQPYLNLVLNGKKNPSMKLCEKTCSVLKVSFDKLFFVEHDVKEFNISNDYFEFPFCFMPIVAKNIGLNEAIVIQFFIDWESNYKLSNWNKFEGYHWVSITPNQLKEVFIFLSNELLNATIQNLIDSELIIHHDGLYRVNHDRLNSVYK